MAHKHAVGTRKRSTAKVWLKSGDGEFVVNGKGLKEYFKRGDLIKQARRPLKLTDNLGNFNVRVQVMGGGISGQAGALSLGIARALIQHQPDLRKPLKDAGLLTRDSREKERMKYGLAKRRKSFQWTKR